MSGVFVGSGSGSQSITVAAPGAASGPAAGDARSESDIDVSAGSLVRTERQLLNR